MWIKIPRTKDYKILQDEDSRMYKLRRHYKMMGQMRACIWCGPTWQSKYRGSDKTTWKGYRRTQYR